MNKTDLTLIELTEENIESMIYEIRGQRVMLDFDLARIYGYSTKAFNQQIQRNIERFDEDFMFQLTKEELDELVRSQIVTARTVSPLENCKNIVTESDNFVRSKKSTARIWNFGNTGGRTTLPYAFTEQGIYMLMTVLKGEIAVKQSKTIIRLFKQMKDYIIENESNASLINNKFANYDKRLDVVESKLDVVMDYFVDPSTYKHFLFLAGQRIEADVAFQDIYRLAKHTIHIIDDYIEVKTLKLLLSANKDVKICIISDNVSRNPLQQYQIDEFIKESGLSLSIKPSNNLCHDRFIIIDYQTQNEKIFVSGSSSKDAANKGTAMVEVASKKLFHLLIDALL